MAEITKYNVYLNENQQRKLDLLAFSTGKSHEELINNAVYGYLAIVDPQADDTEPPQDLTEILFYISDAEAAELDDLLRLQGLADLNADEYAKLLLLNDIHPEQGTRAIIDAIRKERQQP